MSLHPFKMTDWAVVPHGTVLAWCQMPAVKAAQRGCESVSRNGGAHRAKSKCVESGRGAMNTNCVKFNQGWFQQIKYELVASTINPLDSISPGPWVHLRCHNNVPLLLINVYINSWIKHWRKLLGEYITLAMTHGYWQIFNDDYSIPTH